MSKVVSLDQARLERDSHLSGEAICLQCGYEHIAVVPVGTTVVECPSCHTMKAVLKYGAEPATACGCYLFMLSGETHGMICWKCGAYQKF